MHRSVWNRSNIFADIWRGTPRSLQATSRGGGKREPPPMRFDARTSILARVSTGRASRLRLHPSREEESLLRSRDPRRRDHYKFASWITFSAQLRHGVRRDIIFAQPRWYEKSNTFARSWKKPFARQRQTSERLASQFHMRRRALPCNLFSSN